MINVAILGAGIGQLHLQAYRTLPHHFRVSAVCDLDTARAALATSNDPDIRLVSDIKKVLADPDIDLIDVCLPPQLHADHVIHALEAGKDVVCEKPIARSLAEVDDMQKAIEKTRRRVFPVFQYRYGAGIAQLTSLIANGLAGRALVASAETHWNRDRKYYRVPWRGTWDGESGGAVLGHAIHCHDLLCHILGPVSSLTAFLDTRVNNIEVDDCAAIAFRMKSGALATSSVTLGAANDTSRFRFCFDQLTAESGMLPYTPAEAVWTFTARGNTSQEDIDSVVASVNAPKVGFTGFLEAVANALVGKAGDEVLFSDGHRSIELVTAIYHSSRRGGACVNLPLSTDNNLFNGWSPDTNIEE